MKGRHYLVVLLAIAMVFVFASCQQEIDNGIAEVSFASGNNAGSKAVTTGDGERIAFEGLTHQIKFISNSGTGYCDLAGAKNGFVAWPTSSVKLGYGSWTVCAQSVNSAGEVVYKNDGVAFTVGNSGLYVDGVKSSNVVITESYCYSAKAKISVSENLSVLTEDGIDINSLDANSSYRTDYTVKWYTSSSADISSLGNANYVSELAGFTLWDNPTVAIEADGLTYALGVIVDNKNAPGFINGSALVMLEGLSNGRIYTIGSKSGEYLQFGVRAVVITNDEGEGEDQGETPDWNLVGHWEATEALPYENVELLGSGMYKYELDIFSNKTMNVTCSLTPSDKPLDHIGGLIMGTGVNFDLRIASTEDPAVNYIASALNPDEGIVAKADTAEWGTLYIWLKNGNIQAFVPDLEGEVDNTTPRTFSRVSETPHEHKRAGQTIYQDFHYHYYPVTNDCGCSCADKVIIEKHKLNANSVCTTCGIAFGNEDPYNQAAKDFSRLFEVPFVDRSIFNSSELTYVRYDNYNALYIRGNSANVMADSFDYFHSVFSDKLSDENFLIWGENYPYYSVFFGGDHEQGIKIYYEDYSKDLSFIQWFGYNYGQDHTHSLAFLPYVAPTCTINGNIEHWVCSECGRCFSASDGINEINYSDTILSARHNFGEWEYDATSGMWVRRCFECGFVESSDYPIESVIHEHKYECCDFTTFTVTDNIQKIGAYAFYSCGNLSRIDIPDSVYYLGDYVFAHCHNLMDIYYSGTIFEWKKIEKGKGWCQDTPVLTIHCSDGDISNLIGTWESVNRYGIRKGGGSRLEPIEDYNSDSFTSAYSEIIRYVFSGNKYQVIGDIKIHDPHIVKAALKGGLFFGDLFTYSEEQIDRMSNDDLKAIIGGVCTVFPVAFEDGTYILQQDNLISCYCEQGVAEGATNLIDLNEMLNLIKVSDEPQMVSSIFERNNLFVGTWEQVFPPIDEDFYLKNYMSISESEILLFTDIEICDVEKTRAFLKSFKDNLQSQQIANSYSNLISADIDSMTAGELRQVLGEIEFGVSFLPVVTKHLYTFSNEGLLSCLSLSDGTGIVRKEGSRLVFEGSLGMGDFYLISIDPDYFETNLLDLMGHSHSLKYHPVVQPTCTSPGTIGFYVCSECGKRFNDPDGVFEISYGGFLYPYGGFLYPTGHSFGECFDEQDGLWKTRCLNCGVLQSDLLPGLFYVVEDPNTNDAVLFVSDKSVVYGTMTIPSEVNGKIVTSIGAGAFEGCSSLISITIPESVTSIGDYAFEDCSSLTRIIIPESLISIGKHAFEDCFSLKSITIPESVIDIGVGAFENCWSLTSITIPDSVTEIGDSTFEYCSSLTSISIPDSVTSIGWDVFHSCSSLTSIIIPDSVTVIGYYAFGGCSSLASISFEGTKTQWNNVTKGNNWNYEVPATVVHCTDGDVSI